MAILGYLFFMGVLAVAIWSIVATVRPRWNYIVALMTGPVAAPALIPVAQRRRVRRLSPLSFRQEVRLIRAAA